MSAWNYEIFLQKRQVYALAVFIFVSTLFVVLSTNVLAKNACEQGKESECTSLIQKKQKELEQTNNELNKVLSQKNDLLSKVTQLSTQLSTTNEDIEELKTEITSLEKALANINLQLDEKNYDLNEKISIRNKVLRRYSKRGMLNTLEVFGLKENTINGFTFVSLSDAFDKSITKETLKLISALHNDIKTFEAQKNSTLDAKNELETAFAQLEALKIKLATDKNKTEGTVKNIEGEEKELKDDLEDIEGDLEELKKLQQKILAAKAGTGTDTGSVGNYESPNYSVPKPSFKPAFAAFSYGAYSHYRGMSQYGAKARADAGQDYKKIISFYYKKNVKTQSDLPAKINVSGHGTMDFQKYLYGLAEMPSTWPSDALKAQAIAGRTYAYRYIKAGKAICTSQSCQVYLKSKADNPPAAWKKAVDETKNMIIEGDSHAMYSSTTGGFIDDGVGWDVSGNWPGDAYEKKAGSPWYYWSWYSKDYRFDSDKCGKSGPWLTSTEMADILNSWVVYTKGSDSDKSKISPITTNCWGGSPYSIDKMKEKANKYGVGYSSVSSVSTEIGNNGKTASVKFKTDQGDVTISGDTLKTVFNLRAPGYISIRSRLFEIKGEN